jgi:hypothetical protein
MKPAAKFQGEASRAPHTRDQGAPATPQLFPALDPYSRHSRGRPLRRRRPPFAQRRDPRPPGWRWAMAPFEFHGDTADTKIAAKCRRIEKKWSQFHAAMVEGRKPPPRPSRWPKRKMRRT